MPNAISGCGYNVSNNNVKNIVNPANFAAIPGNSSSDFNTSNRCGACIQIGNAIITIVDECPYDGNNNPPCKNNPTGHMDLSNAAAGAGNVKGDPNVHGQNQWKYVPCPVNGNVIVRLKSGNSNEIFIENEIVPIESVSCNGQTASRTSYGAWHFSANVPGASCEVTDIAGRHAGTGRRYQSAIPQVPIASLALRGQHLAVADASHDLHGRVDEIVRDVGDATRQLGDQAHRQGRVGHLARGRGAAAHPLVDPESCDFLRGHAQDRSVEFPSQLIVRGIAEGSDVRTVRPGALAGGEDGLELGGAEPADRDADVDHDGQVRRAISAGWPCKMRAQGQTEAC